MRILVIGGSRLVGRHIVQAALDQGHDVTTFNRGQTDPDAFPTATKLTGDRNGDLAALATGEWDATIDVCAYVPRQVRSLLTALGDRAGQYVFVSTISVFSDDDLKTGFTESAALWEPAWDDELDMAKYGPLKVACEMTAAELGDRLLIIRPGYVVGPYDYTERFTHWVREVRAGKPFEAPAAEQPLQCIDGRDLGAFAISCVQRGATGPFNVTAPQSVPRFSDVMDSIAKGLGVALPEITWADPSDTSEALPLAVSSEWWAAMEADLSKAMAAGLRWRPLEETVRDIAAYLGW